MIKRVFGFYFFLFALQAFGQGCLPTVVLGQNLTICEGTSLTLNATNPNATYVWQDGSNNPTFTVDSSGLYWVVVTNVCGSASDSVNVNVLLAPNAALGPDTFLCPGQSITLSSGAFGSGVTAIWNTGSNSQSISVSQAGTYWLTLNNLCGQSTDTIVVSTLNPPQLDLGPDLIICAGETDTLYIPIPPSHTLQWNNSTQSSSQFIYNQAGIYTATLSNACGSVTDQITVLSDPPADFLPDIAFICNATSTANLQSNIQADSYLWSTGSTQSSIVVNQPGTYWMQYSNSCGTKSDTVQVLQEPSIILDLGADRTVCDSSFLQVNAPPGVQVIWSTGDTASGVWAAEETDTIWAEVNTGCSVYRDTVIIGATQILNLVDTLTLFKCPGQSLSYTIPPKPHTNYIWPSLGVADSNITFSTQGTYSLFASNSCGQDSTVYIVIDSVGLAPDLGPDTNNCDRLWLKPNISTYNSITWSNGSNADSIRVLNGTIWVQIDNGCGVLSDTITLNSSATPAPRLPDTLTICAGSSVPLSMPFRPHIQYLWSNGDTTAQTMVSQAGWISLNASSSCNTEIDSTFIILESFPTASNPLDTVAICQGDSALATLPFYWNPDSVLWSSGQIGHSFSSLQTGVHWYTLFGICGSRTDSFIVASQQPPMDVLPDTAFFCPGDSVLLDASSSGANTYLWGNGDSTDQVFVQQSAWLSVQMTNEFGALTDSVFLQTDLPLNSIDLGADTIICQQSFTLNSGLSSHFSHQWSDGSSSSSLNIQQSGTYWLTASNSCQSVSDSIDVLIIQPPQLFLAPEFQFCLGSTLSVNISAPNSSYLWSTGDTTGIVDLSQSGTYWAQLSNPCGSVTDTFDLVVAPPVSLNLDVDTTICEGDSVILDAGTGYFGRTWSNGQTSRYITVHQAGAYYVDAQGFCNTYRDSIVISVLDTPEFNITGVDTICAIMGESILEGPPGMESYLWSDGSTDSILQVHNAGTYSLQVSNGCFDYTNSFTVYDEDVPIVDFGPDTLLCQGNTLRLSSNGHPIQWSDGSRSQELLVNSEGLYWGSYSNSCGVFSDSIYVGFQDSLDYVIVDTVICLDDTLTYTISEPSDSIWWYNGSTSPQHQMTSAGDYTFYKQNSCGTVESTIRLELVDCECEVYIPTAFSPNGDGINDLFEVDHSCLLFGFEIQIFDRWGGLVFQANDSEFKWDGRVNGELLPEGLYHVRAITLVEQGQGYRPSSQQTNLYLFR